MRDPASVSFRAAGRDDARAVAEPAQLGTEQDAQDSWPFRCLWHDASGSPSRGIVMRNCAARRCHLQLR